MSVVGVMRCLSYSCNNNSAVWIWSPWGIREL